jgi:propionyl-CoA carboxylase alpha chain
MIAKLCSWGKDRNSAIEVMRGALDRFEVEGIGHNLPFLSAVMDHERFVSGNITTAFIEEEYPDGFEGAILNVDNLRRLAALAAHMKQISAERDASISGALPNHQRRIDPHWVISLGGEAYPVAVKHADGGTEVTFDDGESLAIATGWKVGETLVQATVGDAELVVKANTIRGGVLFRYRGAELKMVVLTPRRAELSAIMPEKLPPDTSKMLLCPMPGLIVNLNVGVGDEIQEGQALCTVEAMKMENVLRAEKKGIVSKINAVIGDSLAVDDVIMEFE